MPKLQTCVLKTLSSQIIQYSASHGLTALRIHSIFYRHLVLQKYYRLVVTYEILEVCILSTVNYEKYIYSQPWNLCVSSPVNGRGCLLTLSLLFASANYQSDIFRRWCNSDMYYLRNRRLARILPVSPACHRDGSLGNPRAQCYVFLTASGPRLIITFVWPWA